MKLHAIFHSHRRLRAAWGQVGVYIGCCGSELHAQWLSDVKDVTGYEQTGCTMSMFANRLSFFFDFKGPSKAVDTGALRSLHLTKPLFETNGA